MVQVEFDLERGSSSRQTSTLDTPEGDISAIAAGRIQPLPTYTEEDDSLSRPLISTVDPLDTRHIPPTYEKQQSEPKISSSSENGEPLNDQASSARNSGEHNDMFPIFDQDVRMSISVHEEEDEEAKEKRNVIKGYFEAIGKEQGDVIELFLSRNLVTANTTDEDGQTPLLAAVKTKNVKIVQQLLDAGAEPDAFGVVVSVIYTV
jgi:ankyrin repeat protein